MSRPWYSEQTANHLIWAVAVVTVALFCLIAWLAYLRAKGQQQARRLDAEQAARERDAELVAARTRVASAARAP